MRGAFTALLATALVGLACFYSAEPKPNLETLVLTSDKPIAKVHDCLRIYGKKAADDFVVRSLGSDLGGTGHRGGYSPPGASYSSKAEKLGLSLKTVSNRSQLVIRSQQPLRRDQAVVFRWCVYNAGRIPFDWNQLSNEQP